MSDEVKATRRVDVHAVIEVGMEVNEAGEVVEVHGWSFSDAPLLADGDAWDEAEVGVLGMGGWRSATEAELDAADKAWPNPRVPVPSGGLDGVLVTFGESCDGQTWRKVFGPLVEAGYCVRFTLASGEVFDADPTSYDEHAAVMVVRPIEFGADGWRYLTERTVPISDVLGVHVY